MYDDYVIGWDDEVTGAETADVYEALSAPGDAAVRMPRGGGSGGKKKRGGG